MSATHFDANLNIFAVAGSTAGNFTVTGIKTRDKLVGVIGFILSEGAPNSLTSVNIGDEFTITADNTINNAGGTDTTDGELFVMWYSAAAQGGDLNRS